MVGAWNCETWGANARPIIYFSALKHALVGFTLEVEEPECCVAFTVHAPERENMLECLLVP